jgi:Uma2 family endonuclease
MTAMTVNLKPTIELTDEQFYELCQNNPELRFEQTAKGALIIMPPTGGETGNRNFSLIGQVFVWVEQDGTGFGFDSSTVFKLPNGAKRSPDVAWVRGDSLRDGKAERWNALTPKQREGFPPIAPDFVVELRSLTDSLLELQLKMQEYISNGVRLGWLLNPQNHQVEIYRSGQEVEVLQAPATLSGEDVLPGLVLVLKNLLN